MFMRWPARKIASNGRLIGQGCVEMVSEILDADAPALLNSAAPAMPCAITQNTTAASISWKRAENLQADDEIRDRHSAHDPEAARSPIKEK